MKTFLMTVAALMMAANVSAQTGYDDTKHEVSIRYGLLPSTKIFHNNVDYENETYLGSFSAEYFYHAKEWLSIGCVFAYGKWKADYIKYDYNTGEDKKETNYYTFMPAVKFAIFARRISECIQRLHLVCQDLQRQIHIQMVLHINSLQNINSTFRLLLSV